MRILLLQGSPHIGGNTDTLAQSFREGAEKAGHTVVTLQVGNMEIHPCMACMTCRKTGECLYQDDQITINREFIDSDGLILASPIYYYDITAQLRAFLGRLVSIREETHVSRKAGMLITCGDTDDTGAAGSVMNYNALMNRWDWDNKGVLLAKGINTKEDLLQSSYLQQAYDFGLHF